MEGGREGGTAKASNFELWVGWAEGGFVVVLDWEAR